MTVQPIAPPQGPKPQHITLASVVKAALLKGAATIQGNDGLSSGGTVNFKITVGEKGVISLEIAVIKGGGEVKKGSIDRAKARIRETLATSLAANSKVKVKGPRTFSLRVVIKPNRNV